ncbi:MAG: VCBS repeat-containing protein [Verrucomicrobia bacterium]|nr:VCBS repeat-containing protein [Verrucomicrobiota bacterium]
MKNTRPIAFRITGTALPKHLFSVALAATLLTNSAFAVPPANDNLADAITIESTLPVTVTGTNVEATAEAGEPNHSDTEPDADAGRKSVWWQWTSPITGTVTLTTEGSGSQDAANPASTDPYVDTQVGVYTGNSIAGLNLIAKKEDSDGAFAFGWTYMTFSAVQGTTYKIAVDGWKGATGRIHVNLSSGGGVITPPPPPAGRTLTINIIPANAGNVSVSPQPGTDGYADGTVVTLTATPGGGDTFSAWGGAANGSLNSVTVTMSGNRTVNAIFNADHEILVQAVNNSIGSWLFNGTTFLGGSKMRDGIPLNGWRVVGTGDFNNDGNRDVLLQHPDGRMTVWFMNGTTFVSHTALRAINPVWQARAVADFNNDGSPDIAFQNTQNNRIAIWLFDGTDFNSSVLVRDGIAPLNRRLIGAADVDGNSTTDLVFQVSNGRITAWTMNGTTFVGGVTLAGGRAAGPAWTAVGVFDMNNDGDVDILFQNVDGRSAVWFQDGTNFNNAIVLRNGFAVGSGAKLVTAN